MRLNVDRRGVVIDANGPATSRSGSLPLDEEKISEILDWMKDAQSASVRSVMNVETCT